MTNYETQSTEQSKVAPANAPVVVLQSGGPNIFLRFLWFIFIGWWASGLVNSLAWFLNVTILGLPVGLWLINRMPQIATLKPVRHDATLTLDEQTGGYTLSVSEEQQRPFWVRALWFLFVGWWFSAIWMTLAWLAGITLVLLPLAFWMYGMVATVTTLRR